MIRQLLLLAASLLAADAILYYGLRSADASRIFYDRSNVSAHRLDYWVSGSFDPELGWDIGDPAKNNVGSGRQPDYPIRPRYKIKAFGDSFTFGSDVADGDAWWAVIESETRWECLNYGVPGYGPDQALLKYKRTTVPSEITILGIHQENIGRVVNIYRAFYMEDWGPTKPRYFLDAGGLRLEPNPIQRPEDAHRLLDPGFVDSLRRLDYWPRYNDETLGVPRRLEWPALWTILGHGRFFFNRALLELRLRTRPTYEDEVQRLKHYHLYEESSEAFRILSRLIDRFVSLCRERGERPLVVVFPLEHTLRLMKTHGRCVYAPLARYLRDGGIPHLDLGPVFVTEDFPRYYQQTNAHLSPEGNRRAAREIIHALPGR